MSFFPFSTNLFANVEDTYFSGREKDTTEKIFNLCLSAMSDIE